MISTFVIIAALAAPAPNQTCTAGYQTANSAGFTLLADAVSATTTTTSAPTSRPSLRDDPRAIRWRKTIFWSSILIFVGIVGSIAIVRFSRRYADYLKDDPPAPTASEDVWSMHRLPPDAVADSSGDESSIDPDEPPNEIDDDDNEPPPPS